MTDDIKPDETPEAVAVEPKRRGRPPAAAPIRERSDGPSAELRARRAERMARGSVDHSHDQRLSLSGATLDHGNYQYRWVNDEPGRVQRLQRQEWEIVPQDELNGLEGARHAGFNREGRAMNAVLVKKYKPWFREDQDRKLAESREQEKALKRGKARQQLAEQGEDAGRFYAKEGNSITVGDARRVPADPGYTP